MSNHLAISIDVELEIDEISLPRFTTTPGVMVSLRALGPDGSTALSTRLSFDEAQTLTIGQRFRLRLEPK